MLSVGMLQFDGWQLQWQQAMCSSRCIPDELIWQTFIPCSRLLATHRAAAHFAAATSVADAGGKLHMHHKAH